MKKVRFWQLIGACATGICWGWWCHNAILASILPSYLPAPVAIATTQDRAESSVDSSQSLNYRANGEWIGRLMLPSQKEIETSAPGDWVWVEIKNAPAIARQTIGKTLRLTWQPQSRIAADARQVTTNIQFTAGTFASQQQGNIHPQRLNGRSAVGALQSLAGARAEDDVLVRLGGVNLTAESGSATPILTIDREPIQIAGTLVGLVQILGTDNSRQPPCSDDLACLNEYFRVRHYNLNSYGFNGQIETIRIPQMPAQPSGLLPSTIRDLDRSPAGTQGWYIYGQRDRQNLFTVAAIQPRTLFTIAPQREITDANAKLDYLNSQHWQNISPDRGKLSQVKFRGLSSAHSTEQLGDRALAIHLFGGIGGKTGDNLGLGQTVTGHFAYGMATVTQSTFTGELEWNVEYNQVYAHNPNGIIAGKQDWATYMGHLQRGWLGTRPVSDLLISYPPVTTDYDFGGIKLSPLTELQRQLNISAARYRTGDGTGNASVTPATSCVQDANQALYVTIRQLNRQVSAQPQIQSWLAAHPQHSQTLRFRELQSLGAELETTLTPLGIVRQDWQQNAAKLAGIDSDREFSISNNPLTGLVSWRTMLPRGAQDGIAKIFNHRGATIWFLNTYQVGGVNLDITPIAPTILFGQIPILAILIVRMWAGIVTLPSKSDWLLGLGLLITYAAIALPIGFKSGFLSFHAFTPKLGQGIWPQLRAGISLFFMPALVEEVLFRLLLIPHPIEIVSASNIYIWSLISLILFLIYHPFNALTFYKLGNPTFMDWRFLTLAGLLGIVCTIAYLITGSIWIPVIIHWLVVGSWLDFFGGDCHLPPPATGKAKRPQSAEIPTSTTMD